MKSNKIKLTESELKQVVSESVKQILIKEGFFKKIGKWADGVGEKFQNKMDDIYRGYDIKEGNPTSVFDVIEGNGWKPIESKKKPISNGHNYIGVRKVGGRWGERFGLPIDELIEDINIFLNGRGHASHYQNINDNADIIVVDAPLNLIKQNG